MSKISIDSATFYITNVCNLNCNNCSFLNNYALKGHQRWKDQQSNVEAWAERIDPALIFILGGEPLLNPDFLKWMHGVANLWPMAEIRINTNGTAFHLWPELYQELLPYQGRVNISISNHNEFVRDEEIEWIKKFLHGDIKTHVQEKMFRFWLWRKTYFAVKDSTWPECNTFEDYKKLPSWIQDEIATVHNINIHDYFDYAEPVDDYIVFVDENKIRIGWAKWDEFATSAIKFDPINQKMTLHNSDPKKAVSICHGGNCGHIKNGKFYKCEVMSNLPEIISQEFPLDITDSDKKLLLSYTPAEFSWDQQKLENFFQSLNNKNPIPQCKFCPEHKVSSKIYATTKKIKIIKRKF